MAKRPLEFCSKNRNSEFLVAMARYTDSRHFLSAIITAELQAQLFGPTPLQPGIQLAAVSGTTYMVIAATLQPSHSLGYGLKSKQGQFSNSGILPCHLKCLKEMKVDYQPFHNSKQKQLSSQKGGVRRHGGNTMISESETSRKVFWEKQNSRCEEMSTSH